jgi:transcription elongation factor SPT6
MKPNDIASVLAISWGKGDPQKDAITLVFLDEAGRLREHTKIDNLVDQELKDEFIDLLKRRRPDVIVIGGFTMATTSLAQIVKDILSGKSSNQGENGLGAEPRPNEQAFDIPTIYVFDEVARIYQHSKRAAQEFSALSPTAKYCVGLARYTQSPLNEYAALGSDVTAISFEEDDQHLVCVNDSVIWDAFAYLQRRYPRRNSFRPSSERLSTWLIKLGWILTAVLPTHTISICFHLSVGLDLAKLRF